MRTAYSGLNQQTARFARGAVYSTFVSHKLISYLGFILR